MNEQAIQKTDVNMIESLVLKGDLSGLTSAQKVEYYRIMCERVGLDPTTQPFKLLNLSGKQVMYCDRSGAQQLNKIHHVSHKKLDEKEIRDVFIVYMRASLTDSKGERFTDSSGAVAIGNFKGDQLANAIMKAETKAKRRATLDLLGLGILDESEIETIPNTQKIPINGEVLDDPIQESLPQVQSQNASFDQFDPKIEIMNFGKKYNGVEWINVPESYLEWMSEAATGENQVKAKLTLEFKKKISNQVVDPLDNAFGKQKPLVPANNLTLVEKLQYSLEDIFHKEGTVEALEGWRGINQSDIDKLSPTERASLKKIYTNAMKQVKEGV